MRNEMMTAAGEKLTGTPWTVYPRPQMKRDSFLNLNGEWDFSVDYENMGRIRVPFCPESSLSGIGKHFDEGSILSYLRSFRLPEGFNRGRVLLHVGAADQRADVFLNGKPVGKIPLVYGQTVEMEEIKEPSVWEKLLKGGRP